MNGMDARIRAKRELFRGSWGDAVARAKGWTRSSVGLAFALGCLLFLGLVVLSHWPARRRARMPVTSLTRPQTPFEASFAQAQAWYFRAQVITKGRLESLEEWDPEGIRGSAPEVHRRALLARTPEIGRAAIVAREAAAQATTNEEVFRATRLLVLIEQALGHRQEELALARKLAALQPRNPGALLLLARAAEDNGQTALARQAELKSGLPLEVSPGKSRPSP